MKQLSAVIIALNEKENIKRCIDSLKGVADDILVVDSGSNDGTKQMANSLGARVIEQKWLGYAGQKNAGNELAMHDMILSIDADEALSDQLRISILEEKEKDFPFESYSMNRLANYCGKWIRHCGWYPDRKLRLWDRNLGSWQGLVHESVVMESGATSHLKGDILHYSYRDIYQNLERMIQYAKLGAEDLYEEGKNASMFKIVFSPAVTFFQKYILKRGFLDGWYGFLICWFAAQYKFYKYSMLRELNKKNKND